MNTDPCGQNNADSQLISTGRGWLKNLLVDLLATRETMNPRDIMTDAIHNFHPQYQQYTQYSSGKDASVKHFRFSLLFWYWTYPNMLLIKRLKSLQSKNK